MIVGAATAGAARKYCAGVEGTTYEDALAVIGAAVGTIGAGTTFGAAVSWAGALIMTGLAAGIDIADIAGAIRTDCETAGAATTDAIVGARYVGASVACGIANVEANRAGPADGIAVGRDVVNGWPVGSAVYEAL